MRILFKDIQTMVEEAGFVFEKHSNNKAKHYTATIEDKTFDVVFDGKLSDLKAAIEAEGFETFVENHIAKAKVVSAKKAAKAQRLAIEEQIVDVTLKMMNIKNVRHSEEDKALRAELHRLVAIQNGMGEEESTSIDDIAEAMVVGKKKKAAKKAKKNVTVKRKG